MSARTVLHVSGSVDDELSRKEAALQYALAHISRERILYDKTLFDHFAPATRLLRRASDDAVAGDFAHRVAAMAADELDLTWHPGPSGDARLDTDPELIVSALACSDANGESWIVFAAVIVLGVPGEADDQVLVGLNTYNAVATGQCYLQSSDGTVLAAAGASFPHHASDTRAEDCVRVAVDLHAQVSSVLRRSGASIAVQPSEAAHDVQHVMAVLGGERWNKHDLYHALLRYRHDLLSSEVSDLVQLDELPRGYELAFPLSFSPMPKAGRVLIELDHGPDPTGVRFTAPLPVSFAPREALLLAKDLNMGDNGAEIWRTVPFMLGNWSAFELGNGACRLFYNGFLPSGYQSRCSLAEQIEGVVREVVHAWQRVELRRSFAEVTQDVHP